MDRVTTVTTPGETIDMLVTERGIAVHPRHRELIRRLKEETSLKIMDIKELKDVADSLTGVPKRKERCGEIVAVSEYRDGTVLDVMRKVEK